MAHHFDLYSFRANTVRMSFEFLWRKEDKKKIFSFACANRRFWMSERVRRLKEWKITDYEKRLVGKIRLKFVSYVGDFILLFFFSLHFFFSVLANCTQWIPFENRTIRRVLLWVTHGKYNTDYQHLTFSKFRWRSLNMFRRQNYFDHIYLEDLCNLHNLKFFEFKNNIINDKMKC